MESREIRTLILTGFGINSDYELAECFERAGAKSTRVHLSDLLAKKVSLADFDILGIPGGFSFGDHIASGRVFGNRLRRHLFEEIKKHIAEGKPLIGICNGFQVLIKMGLLPNLSGQFIQEATLFRNESAIFEDRWVNLKANARNKSFWLENVRSLALPVRHGEGRFILPDKALFENLQKKNMEALWYADDKFQPTAEYPANPNGSQNAIAGITDPSGCVFGLMPHPEAFMVRMNQPGWKERGRILNEEAQGKLTEDDGSGMIFFYNAVNYVKNKLAPSSEKPARKDENPIPPGLRK